MVALLRSLIVLVYASIQPTFAADVEGMKQECAQLGFKLGTKDNANCAFKLLKRSRDIDAQQSQIQAGEARYQAEQRELEYQQARIRQQEEQLYELQRRSVAAQEQAAQAQQHEADTYRLNNTMQMIMGTGSYYKPPAITPRAPVTCTTVGSFTTCN